MNRFQELKVWQKAVKLSVDIYKESKKFPKEEQYGLTSQLRRSAVSIAANIAEGAGRVSKKEFANFLSIASGSCAEAYTHILIAKELDYLPSDNCKAISSEIEEIQNMLFKLRESTLN